MPDILRLIGGAGTGKTSRLMQEIDRALGLYGIEQIGFSTMTRAARSVAVGRAAIPDFLDVGIRMDGSHATRGRPGERC